MLITELTDNILYEIVTAASSNSIPISGIKAKSKNFNQIVELLVEVKNIEELRKYILILEQLPFVNSVSRAFE